MRLKTKLFNRCSSSCTGYRNPQILRLIAKVLACFISLCGSARLCFEWLKPVHLLANSLLILSSSRPSVHVTIFQHFPTFSNMFQHFPTLAERELRHFRSDRYSRYTGILSLRFVRLLGLRFQAHHPPLWAPRRDVAPANEESRSPR